MLSRTRLVKLEFTSAQLAEILCGFGNLGNRVRLRDPKGGSALQSHSNATCIKYSYRARSHISEELHLDSTDWVALLEAEPTAKALRRCACRLGRLGPLMRVRKWKVKAESADPCGAAPRSMN